MLIQTYGLAGPIRHRSSAAFQESSHKEARRRRWRRRRRRRRRRFNVVRVPEPPACARSSPSIIPMNVVLVPAKNFSSPGPGAYTPPLFSST
jgi:hypothetical protein